jgi:hypothetical protein
MDFLMNIVWFLVGIALIVLVPVTYLLVVGGIPIAIGTIAAKFMNWRDSRKGRQGFSLPSINMTYTRWVLLITVPLVVLAYFMGVHWATIWSFLVMIPPVSFVIWSSYHEARSKK